MKRLCSLSLLFFLNSVTFAQRPIVVGDCTITYKISGTDASTNTNLAGAKKILYIKGKMARADIIGSNYRQSVIYDNSSGTAVVLKEIGTEKYMSSYAESEWKKENVRFQQQTTKLTADTKKILDYDCKKAVITLKDGSSYNIYYAPNLVPSATENPFQFNDIPGLVLEYETNANNPASKIVYAAVSISFDPVPASRFEIPTQGYRVLK